MTDITERLNIMQFGAVGDGTTDDSAALQSLLDAAPDAGGEAFIPAGDYLIDSSIAWPTNGGDGMNITLVGEGSAQIASGGTGIGGRYTGATVLRAGTGIGTDSILVLSPTQPGGVAPFWAGGLRNLAFARAAGSGKAILANAILGGRMENCSFYGFGEDAVDIRGEIFFDTNLSGLLFDNSQLHIRTRVNGTVFDRFQFTRCNLSTAAFRMSGSGTPNDSGVGAILRGHTYDSNEAPSIEVVKATGLVVRDGYFEKVHEGSTDGFCIKVTGHASSSFQLNVLVEGCILDSNASTDIAFVEVNSSDILLSMRNCRISEQGGGNSYFTRFNSTTRCEVDWDTCGASSNNGMTNIFLSTTTPPTGFTRLHTPSGINTEE